MNLRNVLRVYGLLRQFNDDETALLQTLNSLSENERDQLVETLSPVQVKKPKKKSSGAKSQRAQSLAEKLKETPKPHLGEGPICQICSHTEDYEDHAQPSPHFHEFQPPKSNAASGD